MSGGRRRSHIFGRCTHTRTLSVISEGLERVICEQCGDVTIRYESMISGDVSRSQFARKADAHHRRSEGHRPERG